MSKDYLFAEQFRNFHGVTIDQALNGYNSVNGHVLDPDEFQRLWQPNWKEHVDKTLSEKRPMGNILNNWAYAKRFVKGDTVEVARDIRDLTEEMHSAGKTNDVPLYRGARREPILDVEGNKPISYSEDIHAARSFTTGGNGRKIFKAPVGTIRGLRVPDYVEIQRTVGPKRRPEREWLVDPDSIIGRS